MRIGEALRRLDEGLLMRGAFYVLLSAAAVFLVVDLRDISQANAELPGFDPMHESQPVLPPALTDGRPAAPPVEPGSSAEVLRQAIRFDLKPGGVLLVNSSLVDPDRTYRDDIKVIKVPATDIANELNNHRGTNIIMLGALAGASDLYDVDHVRDGMNHYFDKKGKNNPKNVAAFDAGAEAAAKQL
jgi:hypothetical protein